jgi:TRAP-type C4-dicarboxylate transport system substrate-binding protein
MLGGAAVAFVLFPGIAAAGPSTLKLSFITSDRSTSYRAAIKPFIDAVNAEGKGIVEIVLYPGGVLGREIAKQPQAVLDGTADIAYVVPGYTPERFPDNILIELPGLFRDMREATLVYTQLIADNALRGFDDFVVIGSYVTDPEAIHGRVSIASNADLKGKRIRVNNTGEAAALEKLGAIPVQLEVTRISDAISSGSIDAAAIALSPLSDYGIKRVAANHYFLHTSGAQLALVMNRKKFEELPKAAQEIILKYSGAWAATHFIETYEDSHDLLIKQLSADPHRKVIFPSQSDLDQAQTVFKSVVQEWAEKSPHNRELLKKAEATIAKIRSSDDATR